MKQTERTLLHRWTRHEYERLIDHGFLDEDDPIELLDGLLLVKEPQHSPHRTSASSVARRAITSIRIRGARHSSSRSRTALTLQTRWDETVVVVAADQRLLRAAATEGLATLDVETGAATRRGRRRP